MAEDVAFKLNLDAGDAPKTLGELKKRVEDRQELEERSDNTIGNLRNWWRENRLIVERIKSGINGPRFTGGDACLWAERAAR